ncbi:MAG TPA: ATP-binding protein [Candidatus Synoicihabitans sp.]|nr:ATP-binding protein [Candidatus Synoicihabitans sp.]
MWILLSLALLCALAYTLRKLVHHRRAVRHLLGDVDRRQPLLREELPDAAGPGWDHLCGATNRLITEVRQLQQQRTGQLAQLEATLGSLQEAVLMVDSNNYIVLANRALRSMFPRATEVVEQRLELVLHSVAFLNFVEEVRRGDAPPQHEIEFVDNGVSRWVEATGTVIPPLDGAKDRWAIFVLHDITKQKKLELVRKEFVANVSHELRTPLSVIKGYIETLDEGHEQMPLEVRGRFLHTIHRHTERLNSLLEDLLTLSRLESIDPGLQREQVSLPELVEEVVADYRARPAATQHQIVSRLDPTVTQVELDPLKLTQVFGNLLDNAIKYTPKGSKIAVEATTTPTEIMICVRDNGPGIPAEDLPHVFERFYRVDKGRSRDKGGTGLGLSIVKHIVQLHGGRVWAESEVGQGTAICFTLPPPAS